MTLKELVSVVFRRWWLVLLVPAIALPAMLLRVKSQPYQSSFNAVVLLPGDTEIPGNSEKPELMVMDDVPVLIISDVFSEAVAVDLAATGATLTVDEVRGSLTGTRYSRVLTVTSERDDPGEARAIAEAASRVLPAQVNAFLVANPAEPATVQIIDPAGDATRSRPNQTITLMALTVLAFAIGGGLALLAHSLFTNSGRTTDCDDVEHVGQP